MKSLIKEFITGVLCISMTSVMMASPVSATVIDDNENYYGKPLLDGVHGDTNLEDMEYVHYEWSDIQVILDKMEEIANGECTSESIAEFDGLDNQINNYYIKIGTSVTLSTLYYSQTPTTDTLIEYMYSSQLYTKLSTEYPSFMKNLMETDFGTEMLNTYFNLAFSEDIDQSDADYYLFLYFYYSIFLDSDSINEQA